MVALVIMKKSIWVYVAGPYTKGDTVQHVRNACHVAEVLIEQGLTPIVPHLTHLWHLISPHDYEYWMDLDAQQMARCDCILRLPGVSSGADREVAAMRLVGKPVLILQDITPESVEDAARQIERILDPRPEVNDV